MLRWSAFVGSGTAQRIALGAVLGDASLGYQGMPEPLAGLRWTAFVEGGTAQMVVGTQNAKLKVSKHANGVVCEFGFYVFWCRRPCVMPTGDTVISLTGT